MFAGDLDGDGFKDELEVYAGTDALGRCDVGNAGPPSSDWPPDQTGDDVVDVSDITYYLSPFILFTSPTTVADQRKDIGDPFHAIDIGDISAVLSQMFATCTAHPFYGD